MRLRLLALLALALAIGCSNATQPQLTPTSQRSYHGTASVGDFLNIDIDTAALTITYTNLSNGDTGVVPYTVNSDGSYALNDPKGNLVAAYEIPGYAMLLQALKTGSNHATPALVTAVAQNPIALSTFAGNNYNYMQFRTTSGGLNAGAVHLDTQGNLTTTNYWPYGAMNQQSPFNSGSFASSQFTEDSSGTFLTLADQNGTSDYLFGTAQGIFIVDTPNGAIMGLKQATSKSFDPTFAGTYQATYYQKTNAATGQGNVETGTPSLGSATLVVDAQGNITLQDSNGHTLAGGALTAVADTSYLYGSNGELSDPCYGLFTFRTSTASSQQDTFVTFMDRAVLFSSFTAPLPQGSTYQYFYGVGLK